MLELRLLDDRLHRESLPSGNERNIASAGKADILKWLSTQLDDAPRVFKPYLDFRTIRG
ncbi:MAG TPA: hypothetical protein VGR35_10620 [Tepidisphaeraceae bacterium]|nr:hypothetical protein [Tepidisphaeraceae bacterium]